MKTLGEFVWCPTTSTWRWCERHRPGIPDEGAELQGFDAEGRLRCVTIEIGNAKGKMAMRWIADLNPQLRERLIDGREAVTRYFRTTGDRRRVTLNLKEGETWSDNPCTGGWLAWNGHPAMNLTAPRDGPPGVIRLLSIGVGAEGHTIGDCVGWEIEAHDASPEAQSALDAAADTLQIPPGWRAAVRSAPEYERVAHLKMSFARDGTVQHKVYAMSR